MRNKNIFTTASIVMALVRPSGARLYAWFACLVGKSRKIATTAEAALKVRSAKYFFMLFLSRSLWYVARADCNDHGTVGQM